MRVSSRLFMIAILYEINVVALFDNASIAHSITGPSHALRDVSQTGNWYEKLHWFKQAKISYDRITQVVQEIKSIQSELEKKRDPFNKMVSGFLTSEKIDKDALSQSIQNGLAQLNKAISDEPIDVEEEKTAAFMTLENQKKLIETVQRQSEIFFTFRDRFVEAVEKILPAQGALAAQYEERALSDFETIEEIFDDKKARNLYESIDAALQTVVAIKDYLDGALRQYLNQATGQLNQLMPELKKNLEQLQEDGIYLRNLSKQERESLEKERFEKMQKTVTKKPIEKQVTKQPGMVTRFLNGLWYYISLPFTYLYHAIYGS